jgi:hypothetical protein
MNQGLPHLGAGNSRLPTPNSQEKHFHGAAARDAVSQQPRRKDLRIVDDEEVSITEEVGNMREPRVCHCTRVAIQNEQA